MIWFFLSGRKKCWLDETHNRFRKLSWSHLGRLICSSLISQIFKATAQVMNTSTVRWGAGADDRLQSGRYMESAWRWRNERYQTIEWVSLNWHCGSFLHVNLHEPQVKAEWATQDDPVDLQGSCDVWLYDNSESLAICLVPTLESDPDCRRWISTI